MRNSIRTSLFVIAVLSCLNSLTNAQDKYAVVVGVETYDTSFFRNLEFAKDDAEEITLALERLGFDVSLMTSDAQSTALKPNTSKKILTTIKNKARGLNKNDTLLVALSGHGIQYADEKAVDGIKEHFFCPEDANPGDVESLVKLNDVMALIKQCKAERKLLIVDACRNDVLSRAGDKSGNAKLLDLGSVFENERTSPKGTYTLFSCSTGEKSWEHPDLNHSVFSNYVIEYLSGNAPPTLYDKGRLDLDGLIYHSRSKTKKFVSRELGGKSQTPVLRGSTESASWELGSLWFENGIGMRLTIVPAGEFIMGSRDSLDDIRRKFPHESNVTHDASYPQHKVRISQSFFLGIHEVTTGQFREFVDDTGYRTSVERGVRRESPMLTTDEQATSWSNTGQTGVTESFPVTIVNWEDAQAFCKWLGKKEGRTVRLPTQAEWEYACRAGSDSRFFFGDDIEMLARYANVPNRGKMFRIDLSDESGNTSTVLANRTVEKITLKGNAQTGVYPEFKTNDQNNTMRSVIVANESVFDSLKVITDENNVTIAKDQARQVSPIEIPSPFNMGFEYFSEKDKGEPGWINSYSVRRGAQVVFYRENEKWKFYQSFHNPLLLDSNKIEIYNRATSGALHIRVGKERQTIEPSDFKTVECINEGYSHFIESDDGYHGQLAPVGQFESNQFGLYDMHGNVWEWCQDGYDLDYSKRQLLDPKGSTFTDKYVLRGACYI